jgi:deoxyribodipyrimidine photolyase
MNRLLTVLLLGLCACGAQTAEPPSAPEIPEYIQVFRGQWLFLNSSTAFCAEQVPAMKREFERARDHAQGQMEKAETIVQGETAKNSGGYKPVFATYASSWTKYAGELVAAIKRQNAATACPDLLANWQAADADQILEDWRGFMERNGPVPQVTVPEAAQHSAK